MTPQSGKNARPQRVHRSQRRTRMDLGIHLVGRGTHPFRQKERWRFATLCRLPAVERNHSQGPDAIATHRRITGPVVKCHDLHQTRYQGCILQPPNCRRRRMEDSVPNSVWAVRVLRHAVRTHKRPSLFPAMDERDFERISGYLLCGVPGRYSGLLANTGGAQTPRTSYPDTGPRHRTH